MNPTNPIQPKNFIEQLCQYNGGNSDKDATIANALTRDIQTGFIQPGSFINELIQNADDQALENSDEISFSLIGNELIVYHNGKPFDDKDVKGICSYGNVGANRKKDDHNQSGYKDLGFKSVFRMAFRVDIWSQEWHFHFDEKSPKWKGDKRYPWQIAPIWTEKKDLSKAAQESISIEGRTTFVFKLRNTEMVELALEQFKPHAERILFLKKICHVKIISKGTTCEISRKDNQIYLNKDQHSSWAIMTENVPIPKEIRDFLNTLGEQECPDRLKTNQNIEMSFCYPHNNFVPSIHLYSTLPTAINSGFPFLVNAPFLMNPSREALIENTWNVFIIQTIAIRNFEHVKVEISKKNFNALKFLALPRMTGVSDNLKFAFEYKMNELLRTHAFLPAEFGSQLLKISESEIDPSGIYHLLHESEILENCFPKLIHHEIDQFQIMKIFPSVKIISQRDVLDQLPRLIETKSKDKEKNIAVIRLLFQLFKKKLITLDFLKSLKSIFLLTKSDELTPCCRLALPDCYEPLFSFEKHIVDSPEILISEKYLTNEQEKKEWVTFFSIMGVIQEGKFLVHEEINCEELQKIYGYTVQPYLDSLWSQKGLQKPGNRHSFISKDTFCKFISFPFIEKIASCPSYCNLFWQQIHMLNRFGKSTVHVQSKSGKQELFENYLQYTFRTKQLIKDQEDQFQYSPDLYAPSMTFNEKPLNKMAKLPIVLTKEMEIFFKFKNNFSIEDCHTFLLEQTNLSKFNYSFYSFVMKQLFNHLRDPEKKTTVLNKSWKFLTEDQSWQYSQNLKYWCDSSEPPHDDSHWFDPVSSFSEDEMREFCTFFGIQQIAEYSNSIQFEKAVSCNVPKEFFHERMSYILYSWQLLDGSRKISDCYKIYLKLEALTFFLLPEDTFDDGQVFVEDGKCYYSANWKSETHMAEAIGKYLEYDKKEVNQLTKTLKKNLPNFMKDYPIKDFEKEFFSYSSSFSEERVIPKESIPSKPMTPPLSPRGPLQLIPFHLKEKPLEKADDIPPILPTTPITLPASSPPKVVTSPKHNDRVLPPLPEQPSPPSSTQNYTSTPYGPRTPKVKNVNGGNKSPKKELTKEELIQRKREGLRAEKHILNYFIEKYKRKDITTQIEKLEKGIRRLKQSAKVIDLIWNNDPVNRPVGREEDELWDSGKPFDIEIVKKIDVNEKRKMIEVKGTSLDKVHFFLGSSEWSMFLTSAAKTYQIYMVTSVNSNSPNFVIYKDLLQAMKDREFSYISKTEFAGKIVLTSELAQPETVG